MKAKKIIFLFCAIIFGLSLNSKKIVQAEINIQNADFEVQPILPAEQDNMDLNYFSLHLDKGQKKVIQMRIQNFTDHEITVHSDLRNAMTQVGGGINFKNGTAGLDASLKHPLTKIVKIDKSVKKIVLSPRQTKILSTTITMPSEQVYGLIYGDWYFVEFINKAGGQSSVSSNYAYSVGIALKGQHYKVYPELKYQKTSAILYNQHPTMGIRVRNTQPMALNKVNAKAIVSKKGLFQAKHVVNINNKSIAPNSVLILPVSWDYNRLKPGKYTVEVIIRGQNLWNKLPMTYHFKKQFVINSDEALKINNKAIKRPTNKWAYAAALSGVVTLLSFIILIKVLNLK